MIGHALTLFPFFGLLLRGWWSQDHLDTCFHTSQSFSPVWFSEQVSYPGLGGWDTLVSNPVWSSYWQPYKQIISKRIPKFMFEQVLTEEEFTPFQTEVFPKTKNLQVLKFHIWNSGWIHFTKLFEHWTVCRKKKLPVSETSAWDETSTRIL